jgi:DNA uptake protein ComE-like DNA-binding protein
MRLGFSGKQAQSIINYRESGGHFRRPSDFAKSYVVADSVFRRLEPFIRIPKVDLNAADSVALDALPGIGPYYAVRIVEHRTELGGYSYPEQLMDIYRFDQEKFDALKDLISVSPPEPYALWTLSEEELEKHPYIGKYAAHGIVLYRDNNPKELWTVEGPRRAGVLRPADAARLARCRIAEP